MHLHVDVDGALNVKAGDNSSEFGNALAISGPLRIMVLAALSSSLGVVVFTHNSTKEGGVIGVEVQIGSDGHIQLLQQLLERSVGVSTSEGTV